MLVACGFQRNSFEKMSCWASNKKRGLERPRFETLWIKELLDLCFFEFDVLTNDWIVFRLGHLFRHRAAVLLGYIEETGVRARQKLDLDRGCFRHGVPAFNKKRAVATGLVHGEFWRETTNRARKVKCFPV